MMTRTVTPSPMRRARAIACAMGLLLCATAQAQWQYTQSRSAMTDQVNVYAQVISSNVQMLSAPYAGGTKARLSLRYGDDGREPTIQLAVSSGQLFCPGLCSVSLRFDNDPAESHRAEAPDDGSSEVVFIHDAVTLLDRIRAAKRLRVETLMFQEGARVFDFKTAGLRWPPPLQQPKSR